MKTFGKEAGLPTEQRGHVVFSYSTGQRLYYPVITSISTPYLAGSAPRLFFGTCRVGESCKAIFLLSNPTDVPARWTVSHVDGGGSWRKTTTIRVGSFKEPPVETDDPQVFEITPTTGQVPGPTVSVAAAVAAPPKDFNRR